MQWVVYGAGAVGGVVGGLLHEAGHDVVLVARGAHHDALARHGLSVRSASRALHAAVPVAASAGEVEWSRPSTVLLAVKSQHTHAALEDLASVVPAETPLVCLQNGVSNEPAALRFFETVLGVCVMLPSGHLEPGVVEAHCAPIPGILDVGRFPDGTVDACGRVEDAFVSAGFICEQRPDIMAWKHRKLVTNLANAVDACCAPGPHAEELSALVRAEGERALVAAGIALVSEAEDRDRRGDILQRAGDPQQDRGGSSSWQSLRRATGSIEADYLNGEVVRLGRLHDVPTPANELVRRTAGRLARRRGEPASLDAGKLLQELGSATGPAPRARATRP